MAVQISSPIQIKKDALYVCACLRYMFIRCVNKKRPSREIFLDMHLYNYCLINLILQIIIQNSWQL